VMVNGKTVPQGGGGKAGWKYEGNTLTTAIPVASSSVQERTTIEVRRVAGLTARRSELDGFAGRMTLLRGAYDAMQETGPVAGPSTALVDAMQSGDRLSYYPDRIETELAHLQQVFQQAQADVAALDKEFEQRLSDTSRRIGGATQAPADVESEKQKRRDALHRAEAMLNEAAK